MLSLLFSPPFALLYVGDLARDNLSVFARDIPSPLLDKDPASSKLDHVVIRA